MTTRTTRRALLVAAALVIAVATPARAQVTGIEVGTSLISLMVNWGDHSQTTTFGIPSGGFGIVNPGVYVSVFAGSHIAIEPQIGLVFISTGGHSAHTLNVAGRLDYFLKGSGESSPFVKAAPGEFTRPRRAGHAQEPYDPRGFSLTCEKGCAWKALRFCRSRNGLSFHGTRVLLAPPSLPRKSSSVDTQDRPLMDS